MFPFRSSTAAAPDDAGLNSSSHPQTIQPTSTLPSPASPPSAPAISASPISAALEESALTVVSRTALCTAAGAILGSTVGIVRAEANVPPILVSVKGARSAFLFAGPFYAIREYLLNPISLTYLPSLQAKTSSPLTKDLATSPIAGGLVGLLTALAARRGAMAVKATTLCAGLCFFGQVVGNQINAMRIDYRAQAAEEEDRLRAEGREDYNTNSAKDRPFVRGFAFKGESDPFPNRTEAGESSGFFASLYAAIPIVGRISDDEYLSKLDDRKRLLEAELEAIKMET